MQRWIGWIVAGIGTVVLVLVGLWMAQPDHAAEGGAATRPFVVPVTLATLERGDLRPQVSLRGPVRAGRRAKLGFDTSGIISELVVVEADIVEGDATLARLHRGDEEHELASAEAAFALAQRQHDLLLAGERDEEKRRLYAVLEATRAEAELARLEVERGAKLLEDRILSQSDQDRRMTASNAAEQRRAAAKEEYEQALAGARSEDLAIAAARVDEARARVSSAKHLLGKTELVAPWTGSIVQRFVSVGDYVSAGDPVFELVDLENLEVHIEVPARFAPRLGSHSDARLRIDGESGFAINKPIAATIAAADESARSFRAIVRLNATDDGGRHLKPGMFVRAEVDLGTVEDALLVASDCVLANENGTYVVRAVAAEGGEGGLAAEFVPVRVLAQAEGRSAIASESVDLAAGDRIVLTGGDNAFPGATLVAHERPEAAE